MIQFSSCGRLSQLAYGHLNASLPSHPVERYVDRQQQQYLQAMTSPLGASHCEATQYATPSISLTLSPGSTLFPVDYSGVPLQYLHPSGTMISGISPHGLVAASSVAPVAVTRLLLHQLRLQQQQQEQLQQLVHMRSVDRSSMQSLLTRHISAAAGAGSIVATPRLSETTLTRSPARVVVATLPASVTAQPECTKSPTFTKTGTSLLVCHPVSLALPEDVNKLSPLQVLLRHQIEAFPATEEHVITHARGRTKKVRVGQVGIRCRHCAHLPLLQHQKGSTYFPTTVQGFYQASQNMAAAHLQNGACSSMSRNLNDQFANLLLTKGSISGAGRQYWTNGARRVGLVDTDQGVYFAHHKPSGVRVVKQSDAYRASAVPTGERSRSTNGPASSSKRIKN